MRAWIFSDLHLDANSGSPLMLPRQRPKHDVVVIAGDLCQGLSRGVRWLAEQHINEKPVIYVPGNHEYYSFDFEAQRSDGRNEAARQRNIYVLDREDVVVDGVRFLGATLWTDYCLFGERFAEAAMQTAEETMNDHRLIRYKERRWTAADAAAEHRHSRMWLDGHLAMQDGAAVVVVTHTAPGMKSVAPRYRSNLVTAAFASNLKQLASSASLWVHGHTHIGCDYRLGKCRVVNNPRGYIGAGEGAAFDPSFICEFSVGTLPG